MTKVHIVKGMHIAALVKIKMDIDSLYRFVLFLCTNMSVVNDRKKKMGVLLHSPRSFTYSFLVVPSCFVGVAAATQTTKKMNRRTKIIYFTLSGIKKPSLFYLRLSYSTTLIFPNYVDCAHSTATLHLFLPLEAKQGRVG